MLRVTWSVEGVTLLDRSFSRVNQSISDLRPYWGNVQRKFWQIESTNLKSENARGASGKFVALSRPYAKRKAQRYGVQPILRASGRQEASLTGETGDTVLFKDKMEFGIGTSLKYSKFHQTGTKKMPKRPPVDPSESQKDELMKELQRDILKDMRSSGLEVK